MLPQSLSPCSAVPARAMFPQICNLGKLKFVLYCSSMKYTREQLKGILARTNDRCHLCYQLLHLKNYGCESCLGWHVDHSHPKARGGTDHLNNLMPACASCNIKKGIRSARSVRASSGRTRPPLSARGQGRERTQQGVFGCLVFVLAALIAGRRSAAPVAGFVGMLLGTALDPED